jgi:hypothetical protein
MFVTAVCHASNHILVFLFIHYFTDFLDEMSGKKDVKFVLGDDDSISEEGEYKKGSSSSLGKTPAASAAIPVPSKTTPISINVTSPTRNVQLQPGAELSMSPRTMLRY